MTRASPQAPLRFEDYERLIHKLTRKFYGWACVAAHRGKTPSYDDIFQDLALVWVQCRDQFDPSVGAPFSSYYYRAALNHWPRCAKQVMAENATVSIEEPVNPDDQVRLEELLTDPAELSPEERFARREWVDASLDDNPLLSRLLELSADPPPDLKRELMALAAQQVWMRERGLPVDQPAPVAFTPNLLIGTFNFNWRHRLLLRVSEEPS